MPFCTECGQQNPDDARFCSQCGTALATAGGRAGAAAEPAASPPRRSPSARRPRTEADERTLLTPPTRPRSTRCPPGSALLVVQRGPSAGSRFLLDTDVVTAGRHPDSDIFLDDVTVSRRHAEFRRDGDGFTVADVGSLNGTYVNRDRIDEVAAAGRRRGPDRQVPAGLLRQPRGPGRLTVSAAAAASRARMSIGEVLAQLRAGVPGRHHLQDPVPRGRGLVEPERTPSGYRKFSGADIERLRYILTDAARPLPAAEGDQGAPRRDRPRARAAADRAGGADRPGSRWPADGLPERGVASRALQRPAALPHASCSRPPRSTEELLDQLETFGLVAPRPVRATTTPTRWSIAKAAARAGGVRPRAAAPARVQDRRRPRGRPDRAGRRARSSAAATRPPQARAEETRRRDRRAVGPAARRPGQGRPAVQPADRPATCTGAIGPSPLTHRTGVG